MPSATYSGNFSDRPFRLDLNLSTRDDPSRNRSDVDFSLVMVQTGNLSSFSFFNNPYSVTIDGETFSGTFTHDFRNYNSLTIRTGSKRVNHNSDGRKTITVRGTATSSVAGSADTGNRSFALTSYPRAPDPPPSVTAAVPVGRSITVSWQAASGGAGVSSYDVERRESTNGGVSFGGWSRILSGTTSLSTTSSSLNPRSTYQFRVRANGPGGSSGYRDSNLRTISPAATPPSISTQRTARSVQVSLGASTVLDSGINISSYSTQIRQSSNGGVTWGSWGNTLTANTTTRTTTYTNLSNAITYQFRGRAETNLGASDWTESGLTTIPNPPPPPESITAERLLRTVTVSLGTATPPAGVNITGYSIQRRESANGGATWGDWGDTRSVSTSERTFTYTNLKSTFTQQFRGRAESDVGPGGFVTSQTILIPGIPDAPSQLLANQLGASVQVIAFQPSDDGGAPVLTYTIEKRVSDDFGVNWEDWGSSVTINATTPIFLYDNLELQRTYQFRALATNEEGNSENFTESNSVYLPTIVRIFDDGEFRLPNDYKRYDEEIGDWIGLGIYKRYLNGQWVDLT